MARYPTTPPLPACRSRRPPRRHPHGPANGHGHQGAADVVLRAQFDEDAQLHEERGAGGATTVLAAVGKRFEGKGELYIEDCGVSTPVREDWGLIDPGYVPGRTDDAEAAARLWDVSCGLVGVDKMGL